MFRIPRQSYTDEFKWKAVRLVKKGIKSRRRWRGTDLTIASLKSGNCHMKSRLLQFSVFTIKNSGNKHRYPGYSQQIP